MGIIVIYVIHIHGGLCLIFCTDGAFAALNGDGSVVTWGDSSRGGNSSPVVAQLAGGVVEVFSNQRAFVALKSDQPLVTITMAYQWTRDGNPIAGETNSTYTLTQADVGKAITVTAGYTDGAGNP